MHFRNSWMRSMSSCCIRHVPSASRGRGLNGGIFFAISKLSETSVTRSLMTGNDSHRRDGDRLPFREVAHARHAHEARLAVDLRAARAAAPRLAVPAHRERRLLLGLDVVDGVEHHHARVRLDLVRLELAPFASPRKTLQRRLLAVCPLCSRHFSSRTVLISAGTSGSGTSSTSISAGARAAATMFTFAKCSLSMSREVFARVPAAALLAGERRARHRLADDEHVPHVDRLVPRRVVVAVARRPSRATSPPSGARGARALR